MVSFILFICFVMVDLYDPIIIDELLLLITERATCPELAEGCPFPTGHFIMIIP